MKTFQKERTVWDAFFLILKGVAMGAANKVPGVSGGIVALVGGFYEELIYSFQRLNFIALKLLFTGRIKSFWSYTNASFLSLLFCGVIVSYFSISLFLDYALTKNETVVMGAFLGMVLASLYLIIRQVPFWNKNLIAFLVLGFLLGLSLSIVKPISENDKLLFVFFCGIISVAGMPIPGLAGSFLLLILGNYNLLLVDAVNALFRLFSASLVMDFSLLDDPITSRLLLIMLVFAIGSVIGLVLFSNLIKLILDKYPNWKAKVYGDEPRETLSFKHKNLSILGFKDNSHILNDLKKIVIDIKIPENYVGILKPGLKAEIKNSAFNKSFKGKVESISSRIDPSTRSILARIIVDNSNFEIIPGQLMTVKVIYDETNQIGVPESAVTIQGNTAFVYVVNADTAEKKNIKMGKRNFGKVSIISGINEGDMVISEGVTKVRNKAKVKIINP